MTACPICHQDILPAFEIVKPDIGLHSWICSHCNLEYLHRDGNAQRKTLEYYLTADGTRYSVALFARYLRLKAFW